MAHKITASPTKSQSLSSSLGGFTFIEILTVTVMIGVLVTITVVAYVGASRSTRDSRRKQDLSQLRFAVEAYRQSNGEYPDPGVGCGAVAYQGCESSGDWIIGLSPDFIVSLPTDPRQAGGGSVSDPEQYAYWYEKVSDSSYVLMTKLENKEDRDLNGTEYGLQEDLYVLTEPK